MILYGFTSIKNCENGDIFWVDKAEVGQNTIKLWYDLICTPIFSFEQLLNSLLYWIWKSYLNYVIGKE